MLSAEAPPASPARISTASPGTCCSSRKFSTRMPATVGSACSSLRFTAVAKSGIAGFQQGQIAACAGGGGLEAAQAAVVNRDAMGLRQCNRWNLAHHDFLECLELLGALRVVGLDRGGFQQPVEIGRASCRARGQ